MFEAAQQALQGILAWPAIGYLFLGILLGVFFGMVPGLSGLSGMAILLPFTFDLQPYEAMALLMGMYAITSTSDTIASVLLGVPGTAGSQATIMDGYPMAKKGEAGRAFGAAYTVSAFGGVMGAIVLVISIPVLSPLVLSFGSPEFFMLAVLGMAMVGSLSGGSPMKGLLVALLALLLSMIGYSPQAGIPRLWLGWSYLLDGLPLVPTVLGLFSLPEVVDLAVRRGTLAEVPKMTKGIRDGVRDAFHHRWLSFRCALLGAYIGFIPGLGASIVDWVAYGHAVQSSKDSEQFGKGDVRGVIAPESANNAMKGGALIPTVAFGVPGSATMAILLGAFLIHGIYPGPELLTTRLDVLFSVIWALVIANVATSILLMGCTSQLAKVTTLRGSIIIPIILVLVFMGSWMATQEMGDWIVLFSFGFLGYLMKRWGWPRPPIALGIILGRYMERYLDISLSRYGWTWLGRPIVVVLIGGLLATIYFAVRRRPAAKMAAQA
ncbi:MAG: tripartite tricarboxylate transporter permease [Candidatus Binatia bacterium]|jgi:TctA family transporter|nr:tripartite tricarboxylate transporter permease [Candidatus Binatia bacterium]